MLFIPASIQLLHAFEIHEHVICTSDFDKHLHEDDPECILCHLQADYDTFILNNQYKILLNTFSIEYKNSYNFYKSHQLLSFQLRGPPTI